MKYPNDLKKKFFFRNMFKNIRNDLHFTYLDAIG